MKLDSGKFAGVEMSEIPTGYLEVLARNGEIARKELENRSFGRLRSLVQRYPTFAYRLISGWQFKSRTDLTEEQKTELNNIIAGMGIEPQPILTMNEEFMQYIAKNSTTTEQPLSSPTTTSEASTNDFEIRTI